MDLELKSRVCGSVHLVECKGRIVAGVEGQRLETVLREDWCRDLSQVLLHMGEVTRLDSMGLGLIVRHAMSLRKRGGDLRLTDVTPPVMELLALTKINSVVQVFGSEQEALLSYLQRTAATESGPCGAGCVMLLEQSHDFCAFAAAVLTQHGYEVKLVSLVRDAKVLLQVQAVDVILMGPSTPVEACDGIAATLRSVAGRARVLRVDPEVKGQDAHHAAETLVRMVGAAGV